MVSFDSIPLQVLEVVPAQRKFVRTQHKQGDAVARTDLPVLVQEMEARLSWVYTHPSSIHSALPRACMVSFYFTM